MSIAADGMAPAPRPARSRSWKPIVFALLLWVAAIASIFPLSGGSLPFQRPALARVPFRAQVLLQLLSPVFPLFLIGITYLLTRRRSVPNLAERAPDRSTAKREVLALWSYGAIVVTVGQILGRQLFGEGIGLHLNGSLFGPTRIETPSEVWTWAAYNFVLLAALPYLAFRRRGYSSEQLNLNSSDVKNDTLVILVVLALESALELSASGFFGLTGHQMAVGAVLSFIVHLLGTGLPVMIFIYSILMPRYARLSGSVTNVVLLGALSYAALHIFEYWTVYDSPRHALLSLIFALTTFIGPGLIKSYLTVRTGNAWVHLWAYHAIAPHVTSDTTVVVRIFGVRL